LSGSYQSGNNNNGKKKTGSDEAPRDNNGRSKRGGAPTKLWVPFVVILGALVGVVVFFLTAPVIFVPSRSLIPLAQEILTIIAVHIILSTIAITLLVSLIVVYVRTYSQTRANFILGLLAVLFALLLQNLLDYPLATGLGAPGSGPFPREFFPPIADIFTIIAYAVFLYLSLE
jgi:magnesium-transporting ATPase (P-type)